MGSFKFEHGLLNPEPKVLVGDGFLMQKLLLFLLMMTKRRRRYLDMWILVQAGEWSRGHECTIIYPLHVGLHVPDGLQTMPVAEVPIADVPADVPVATTTTTPRRKVARKKDVLVLIKCKMCCLSFDSKEKSKHEESCPNECADENCTLLGMATAKS